MSQVALTLKCSVEADASPDFAWRFRTDISNWDDPPAKFVIHGPFEAGSYGTTELPGQAPLEWQITQVSPGKSFVVEMQLDKATLTFEWQFDELSGHKTKLTQTILLSGENAAAYVTQVEAGLRSNLEPGMSRIAADMAAAAKRQSNLKQDGVSR